MISGAVVVPHLVELLLPTPEVHGSNPVIGKKLLNFYCQLFWKDKNKEKEADLNPFDKKENIKLHWISVQVTMIQK